MRNITEPSDARNFSMWETPAPYVGFAATFVIVLTVFLLTLLFCSAKRDFHNRQLEENNVIPVKGRESDLCSDDKNEKFIVIMAGDAMPSYIAMPSSLRK